MVIILWFDGSGGGHLLPAKQSVYQNRGRAHKKLQSGLLMDFQKRFEGHALSRAMDIAVCTSPAVLCLLLLPFKQLGLGFGDNLWGNRDVCFNLFLLPGFTPNLPCLFDARKPMMGYFGEPLLLSVEAKAREQWFKQFYSMATETKHFFACHWLRGSASVWLKHFLTSSIWGKQIHPWNTTKLLDLLTRYHCYSD